MLGKLRLTAPGLVASFIATGALFVAQDAAANDLLAYTVPTPSTGNQLFNGSLGMDFNVVRPVLVYALGVYDSGQDGLTRQLKAKLYDRTSTATPLATLVFPIGATGTLVGAHRILPLPCPIFLAAGFQGSIVAENHGAGEQNGNIPQTSTTDTSGALAFVGGSRWIGALDTYPTNIDAQVSQYSAGTFLFAEICTSNTDCNAPSRPQCSAGICGAATGPFYPACTGATASCNTANGTCTACNGNLNTPGATAECRGSQAPACTAGACTGCSATVACTTSAAPVCTAAGACNACTVDNLPAGAGNHCPTTTDPYCKADGSCGKCTVDADCNGRVGLPYCAPDGSCSAACTSDAQCGNTTSGKICSGAPKACVDGCAVGAARNGCAAGQVCSTVTNGTEGTCSAAPVDAGTPVDSGAPVVDSGSPEIDSGSPEIDSGTPGPDSGVTPGDSGVIPNQDSGTFSSTSSTSSSSSGSTSSGAGSTSTSSSGSMGGVDSGASSSSGAAPADDGGCSTVGSSSSATTAPFLVAAAAILARLVGGRKKKNKNADKRS